MTEHAQNEAALAAQLLGDPAAENNALQGPFTTAANAPRTGGLVGIASPAVTPGLAKASALESTLRERHDREAGSRYTKRGQLDPNGQYDRRGNLIV